MMKPQNIDIRDIEMQSSLEITKLSSFQFHLPESLIAQHPEKERDESRLMVLDRGDNSITIKKFYDILDYFDENDLFVVNNSKVFPARMTGKKEKTGAKIDVFLQRELNKNKFLWDAIVEPARKIRVGNKLFFGTNGDFIAEIIDNTTSRGRTLKFLWEDTYEAFKEKIYELGFLPLPKHITRKVQPLDYERYHSVFGTVEGSVVTEGAALHFSNEIVKYLEVKGVQFTEVTLHSGLSTYRVIDIEDLNKYKIDSEHYMIPQTTADKVNQTIKTKNKICAVGCSTFKALESSYSSKKLLVPQDAWTSLYIFPPYVPKIPTALLTNFHPAKTILYTNVCAFGGYDLVKEAYRIALKEKFKFCVYGDAMLII